jgi:hydroxymethylpyrimidine/phosphomethylpyrimidine kinase
MRYKRVLTIAGSDSGGGAGIQADIKTISACGCFATSAITAITAQNTLGVSAIHTVPNLILEKQIRAVLDDIGTDAVKIGMLHSSGTIITVAETLAPYRIRNIVLDPVMVATSGDKLLMDEAVEALKLHMIPGVRIITPNIPEAEILLGRKMDSQADLLPYARDLGKEFGVSVLLKAGHLRENVLRDVFYNSENRETMELPSERIKTRNTHGTGCTLSSALASYLARGKSMEDAVRSAKQYMSNTIRSGAGYTTGKGHGPVHHFYQYWKS